LAERAVAQPALPRILVDTLRIAMARTPQQRKANVRLGLILAALALAFALAFVVKMRFLAG
jgi:hypothetical protein